MTFVPVQNLNMLLLSVFLFMPLTRIYHRYEKWECWKSGFFYDLSGKKKPELIEGIQTLFSSPELTREYMQKAIDNWPISAEQNLTNESMNRIAWLGQAACCIYCGANQMLTMQVWNTLSIENRTEADSIAAELIKTYEDAKNTAGN